MGTGLVIYNYDNWLVLTKWWVRFELTFREVMIYKSFGYALLWIGLGNVLAQWLTDLRLWLKYYPLKGNKTSCLSFSLPLIASIHLYTHFPFFQASNYCSCYGGMCTKLWNFNRVGIQAWLFLSSHKDSFCAELFVNWGQGRALCSWQG